ncbi:hypothetical protein ECTOBSL9_0472 [Ectothiorhodospira sp. BSL-9]|nr:hypothetical protein ECTOBSL9_0472 [Ectothiorhodospira sp. BSL-9]
MLDFDSLRYDQFSPELIRAMLQSSGNPESAKANWQHYFQHSGVLSWHDFKRSAGLAFTLNLLSTPRLIKNPNDSIKIISTLTDLLGNEPDETEWTDIMRIYRYTDAS